MTKKRKPKKKDLGKEIPKSDVEKNFPPAQEEERPFDFGGIPNRDLKKNLGCG